MVIMEDESFIQELMRVEGINERKANALFDAGYSEREHFQDATIEDLILVKTINPTLARRVLTHYNAIFEKEKDTIFLNKLSRSSCPIPCEDFISR